MSRQPYSFDDRINNTLKGKVKYTISTLPSSCLFHSCISRTQQLNTFHSNCPQNLEAALLFSHFFPSPPPLTYTQPPHSAVHLPQLLPNNSQAVTDCQHCVWGLEKYSCGTAQCVSTAFSQTQCHSL